MHLSVRKFLLVLLFATACHACFAQDESYMNMADTNKGGLFKNFVGVKLFAADFGATSMNQDLKLKYATVDVVGIPYTFQHDMNITGLKNFYNLGLGMEENLGKHLMINFFNTSIGYIHGAWDWNVNTGAGYFVTLNKQKTMRLNASINIGFESITYSYGSYYDTTGIGFNVDGTNVGIAINNVKYVNTIWTLSSGLEFVYRRRSVDFFAAAYYNYVFTYSEKINFYRNKIPISEGIIDQNGNPVSQNAINLGNYIIQVGIIREFGL